MEIVFMNELIITFGRFKNQSIFIDCVAQIREILAMMQQSFVSQTQKGVQFSYANNYIPSNMSCYLLQDYAFLNEYQLLDSPLNSQFQFMAKIKATQQLVKFKKQQLLPLNTTRGTLMYKRFQTLFALYQQGVILADNIFILSQAHNQHFYYIIEPYLSPNSTDSSFLTLQQYLFENRTLLNDFQSKKNLFIKCKNLLDKLSLYDVAYYGLNSKRVVVDDQGSVFLLPFQLNKQLINKPYQRAYYPPEILSYLKQQQHAHLIEYIQKWDIWSFACITLDIFLYLTPCFLSTSVYRQQHKIKNQMASIFKDFQSEFLSQNNSDDSILQNQERSTQLKDKQKILNFLMNIFHEDLNKRQFSFNPIHQEKQLLKSERRTPKAKRQIKRLLQKSRQKLNAKTNHSISLRNSNIKQSRIFNSSQISNFKELNVCQETKKNANLIDPQAMYSFQIKLKTLLLQTQSGFQPHSQLRIVINFSNRQKFQFFTPFTSQNSQKRQLSINKKISFFQKHQKFIQHLLQQDIQITLSIVDDSVQKEKQAYIFINLSALMIKDEQGERLWKKPIKGAYKSQKDSSFQCKLKIEAEIQEYCSSENSLSKPTLAKVQMVQQKTEKKFSIVHWLRDIDQKAGQEIYNRNLTEQIHTSRFEQTLKQQNIMEQEQPQSRASDHQQKPIYNSSLIDSHLHEISNYQKQTISKQQPQSNQKHPQQIIQTQNTFKLTHTEQNTNNQSNQQNPPKNLQAKVKKILHQNTKTQKITQTFDLSNRLKRLLMR